MILFSKYHGCGNNFVIVKEKEILKHISENEYPDMARKMCDVYTGAGADGFIVVREEPELEMVFYNQDGSRAPMCGNGIRCFAHFCRQEKIREEESYPVKTLAGEMIVNVTSEEPFMVKINMGKPVFAPQEIKVDHDGPDFLNKTLELADGSSCKVHAFFMGTIHTVVFADDIDPADIPKLGEEICNHPTFKEKTNVNFVKVIDKETLEVKTYERGVGMTLACGTGCCASVVAANLEGLCADAAETKLAIGSLRIELGEDGNVYMTGPSVKILDGEFC